MAPDAVDVFSGRTIAAHWAKNQWLVPSDITGDFRPALYKELGIVVPSSLEGCDPEVDYMDVEEVEVFPSAFLNADPHDEDAVVAPIRFGDRGGDMQYLTEVFVTAINDGTFDEVALYARKDLGYPDYMIQRARALAGRSPGARPIKYGRDKAHRSRYFGESTMAGRKR